MLCYVMMCDGCVELGCGAEERAAEDGEQFSAATSRWLGVSSRGDATEP